MSPWLRGPGDERGFTLIEIIVAMVIVAMAMALVAPAIDSGLRAREVRSAVRNLSNSSFETLALARLCSEEGFVLKTISLSSVGNQTAASCSSITSHRRLQHH